MKIYTKTGDLGETSLWGGHRVPKSDLRVDVYGEVDELNAHIGFALIYAKQTPLEDILEKLISFLFELGSEIASHPNSKKSVIGIQESDILWLENEIDHYEKCLKPLKNFILPIGSHLSSTMHICRTITRRVERKWVSLMLIEKKPSFDNIGKFLNRLSDLFFVLSRVANTHADIDDKPWIARKNL